VLVRRMMRLGLTSCLVPCLLALLKRRLQPRSFKTLMHKVMTLQGAGATLRTSGIIPVLL
jgi:hypothetical protein